MLGIIAGARGSIKALIDPRLGRRLGWGMNRDRAKAQAMGLATALMWGLSFLSIKVSLAALPPMTLGLARFVIAIVVLFLIALAIREDLKVAWKDQPLLAAGGFVGVTFYFLCENNGVKLLTASESSLVIGVIPVATMLAERLILGTKLGARAYVGAFLSFLGVGLIAARSPGASSSPLGFVYMAGAALSWVAYSFVTRPVSTKYGRLSVTFWQSFWGLLGFIPFAVAEHPALGSLSTGLVLNLLYLGVFCSALGYWFYVTSLDILGPGPSSTYINLIPVVSVIAAFFLLGERLSGLQLAGGAAAVIGVYLATMPGKKAAE
jgi:drug/metabolite transporter (DMT)-like permease